MLKQTRQISYFWEIWKILSVLNIDYSGFPSCVQDQRDVTQEEASRKETNRIQNPCAKHSFPSHRQGTSGTLLVAITLAQNWTHICNNLRSLSEVIQWCNNCFLFCFVFTFQYIWRVEDGPSSEESDRLRESSRFWLYWLHHQTGCKGLCVI